MPQRTQTRGAGTRSPLRSGGAPLVRSAPRETDEELWDLLVAELLWEWESEDAQAAAVLPDETTESLRQRVDDLSKLFRAVNAEFQRSLIGAQRGRLSQRSQELSEQVYQIRQDLAELRQEIWRREQEGS